MNPWDLIIETTVELYRVAITRDHLRAVPDLIEWLLQQRLPTLERREKDGSKATKAAEAALPFQASPVDSANELYGALIDAAVDFAGQLRVDPPNSALRYAVLGRDCNGLPGWAVLAGPAVCKRVARDVAGWLLDWAADIAAYPGGDDFMLDLNERTRSLQSIYPTAPAVRPRYRRRPCPVCGEARIRPEWLLDLEHEEHLVLRCHDCEHEIEVGDLAKYLEAA